MKSYAPSEKSGGGMSEKVLWTNSNPTASFVGQAVTLSESVKNFDYIRFYYRATTSDNRTFSMLVSVDDFLLTLNDFNTFRLSLDYATSSGRYDRGIIYVTLTTLNFVGAIQVGANSSNNSLLIPTQITGCKV